MDTSKKYYEDKIRDFNRYRRGRTLAQFCKDEGIDYDWMQKAKRKYSGRTRQDEQETSATNGEIHTPSLIELHYFDDSADEEEEVMKASSATAGQWMVSTVVLTDPTGNEITISSGSAAALGNLLTKLTGCHV